MTEQLNYISLAINQLRRATGTRAAPGESCEHIRITNPDRELKNGMVIMILFIVLSAPCDVNMHLISCYLYVRN